MTDLDALYAGGLDLARWGTANTPDQELIYAVGQAIQLKQLNAVATLLPNYSGVVSHPKVVGVHTSKSVSLPVTCFRFCPYNQVLAHVLIRDNFYDIKVVVVSDAPIHIPYSLIYEEWGPERYATEVKRYVDYTEELPPPEGYDEWYARSWSGGTLLRKDGRIYRAGSHQAVYCEGIDDLGLPAETFQPYQDGLQTFVCEVSSYTTTAAILECVIKSLEMERSKRARAQEHATKAKPLV